MPHTPTPAENAGIFSAAGPIVRTVTLSALALVWSAAAPYARAQAPSNAAADPTFTMRIDGDVASLDWTAVAGDNEDFVFKNIMDGLFELGADGRARARLVETWSVTPDGLTYTIKLRRGVKWSDGRELVAADFIEGLKRTVDRASTSPDADQFEMIKGFTEYRHGALADFSKTGFQAPDEHTLVVTLTRPSAALTQLLASTSALPVRADLIKKFGKDAFAPEHLVVEGPFRVADRKPNQSVLLVRNPLYFDAKSQPKSAVAQVRFLVMTDDQLAVQLFKDGKVDLLWTTTTLEAAAPAAGAVRASLAGTDLVYLGLDVTDYPLDKAATRKAIASAIDRAKLPAALNSPADVIDSLLPAHLYPDSALPGPAFDLAKAQRFWKDAGLAAVAPPTLELLAVDGPIPSAAAAFVKSQLETNLGVKINVQLAAQADYEQRLTTLRGSLFIITRRATTLDGQDVLDDFVSNSTDNHLHWKNAAYDALLAKSARLSAGGEQNALFKQELRILEHEDAVVVPLCSPRVAYQLSGRFTGFAPNVFGEVLLRDLALKASPSPNP